VFVLAVTAARADAHPPIGLNQLRKFAVFHSTASRQEILIHPTPAGKADAANALRAYGRCAVIAQPRLARTLR
jgi:hypothetical protein